LEKEKYTLKTGILKTVPTLKESLGLTPYLTFEVAQENRQLKAF
jgi:hypothetical protein